MKLTIDNFAKIEKADIEMNGITVLAGENGTGKSTVSKVLYSIFNTFYDYDSKLKKLKTDAIKERFQFSLSRNEEDLIHNIFRMNSKMNEIIDNLVRTKVDQCTQDEVKTYLKNELSNNNIIIEDFDEFASYVYKILSTDTKKEIKELLQRVLKVEIGGNYYSLNGKEDFGIDFKLRDNHIVFNSKAHDLQLGAYYKLKTEAIYYDNPDVVNLINRNYLKDDNFLVGHERKLAQFLQSGNSNNFYDELFNKDIIHQLKEEIRKIVGGDFVDENRTIKFKSDDLEGSYDLPTLSSGLKSMSILLRLIENGNLKENGVLILDEPEIHLHPKWQLKYAEMLVKLQSTLNLHILISSHSPYFIAAVEAYSAKYAIADRCKYYLSELNENHQAIFKDVTLQTNAIYQKLAEPLRELENIIYDNR